MFNTKIGSFLAIKFCALEKNSFGVLIKHIIFLERVSDKDKGLVFSNVSDMKYEKYQYCYQNRPPMFVFTWAQQNSVLGIISVISATIYGWRQVQQNDTGKIWPWFLLQAIVVTKDISWLALSLEC